jgi:hypothetical protein
VYKNGIKVGSTSFDASSFVITTNLVAGNIYQIQVAAYNDVGESLKSEPTDIMAARVPNAPL